MQTIRDFYFSNATLLNIIILTYGAVMLGAGAALIRVFQNLVKGAVEEIKRHKKLDKNSSVDRLIKVVRISWQPALDAVRFPLIASQSGLLPSRKSVTALQ